MSKQERFKDWKYPKIEEGKLTKHNWLVQHKDKLELGYKTDIGAFTYINAKSGVIIEDLVQVGSHCSIYSVSTIDSKVARRPQKKTPQRPRKEIASPQLTFYETYLPFSSPSGWPGT